MEQVSIFLLLLAVFGVAGKHCTPETATTRQEWGSLNATQRSEYIDAVLCLRHKPSIIPSSQYPGVRDRLDDFVATHINYTTRVHADALLLPWHRHLLFLWEQTLQQECGYTGNVPYWDWTVSVSNISDSPVFDGSATSLSGNGADEPSTERGSGGGCVVSGPFKDYQVHLGPFNHSNAQPHKPPPLHAFDYNPRCLQRNFNHAMLEEYNNRTVLDGMLQATTIVEFLSYMDPGHEDVIGAHGSGHRAVGGAMSDVYSSPQDPSFMLHHAMIDRMWTLWQLQDMGHRRNALNGTSVMYNPPDAPLVNPDSMIEFGVLDRPRRVKELMDPMEYDYCYKYH